MFLRHLHLFFIVLAEGLSANPETLTVHLGLLGMLIGAMMKRRAKKKNRVVRHSARCAEVRPGSTRGHGSRHERRRGS